MAARKWPFLTLGAFEGVRYRVFMGVLGRREVWRSMLPALGWVLGPPLGCGEATPEDEPVASSSTTDSLITGPSMASSSTTDLLMSSTAGSATTDLVTSTTEPMTNMGTSTTGSSGDLVAEEESSSGSSSDTGSDGGTAQWVDLSACGWEPVCDAVTFGGSGMAEPSEAAECVARAAMGETFAVVQWIELPRGETSIFEVHAWILLVGDGTALFQTRTLHCDEDYTLNGDEVCEGELWWSEAQRTVQCEVVVNLYACREDCPEGEDCSCAWNPGDGSGLINCVEHSISDCSEAEPRL